MAVVLTASAFLAAQPVQAQKKDSIVLAVGMIEGGQFDPLKGWGTRPAQIRPIHSSLLRVDADLNFIGDLARDYAVSDDALTWTFSLRENARFSNGEKVTAQDVKFTYDLLKEDGIRFDLSFVDRIEALDETAVAIHLKQPRSTFVSQLTEIPILPRAHYNERYSENPIGSGPYRVVQYDPDQQLILEYNPHWYGQEPQFKRLTFLLLQEDTALAAARAGQVDVVYVPPAFADQTIEGMTLRAFESVDSRGMTLPTLPAGHKGQINGQDVAVGNDVTSDPAIRRALAFGLSRKHLVDVALQGGGRPAYSLVDKLPWFNAETVIRDGDAERARAILAEAGWADTDGDGIVEKDGKKAEFDLLYASSDGLRSDLALVTAELAREFGIKINTVGASWDRIYLEGKANAVVWGGGRHHAHQLFSMYSSKVHDTGYNNMPQYTNAAVDEYLDSALAAASQDVANEFWKKAQWDGKTGFSALGDNPIVWLVRLDHLYLAREPLDFGRQPIHAHGHEWALFNNITEWTWSE